LAAVGESRGRRRWPAAAILSIAVFLGGCSADTGIPHPRTTPTNDPTPSLADAVDAFTRFNSVLDGYVGGTASVEEFRDLVTPEYFGDLAKADENRATTTRTIGASSFGDEKLVDPDDWGGFGDLSLVVCRDISHTTEVNLNGDPTTSDRQTRIPMIIFYNLEESSARLLVTKVDKWAEEDYCS
jgi:hypothetical protein